MVWATQAQHCCLPHMQAHASRAKATAGPSRVGGAARTLRKCGGWLRLRGVGRSTRSGEPIIFRDKLSGAASRAVIERTSRWPGPQSKEQVEELPVSVALRRPVPGYRPDIDGLRAVAVISVVIFHAFPGALAGGFAGVDIFFAISGYLISQHIIETLDQGRFSLVDFYVRRIKRIYPALVTVMVATLVAGIAVMASGELRQLAADALASVAFVANIYFYMTRDYFSQGASASPLLHLWSLGVEEQYYIIWPVALFVLWRFASRRVATFAIAAAILLSFACSIVLSRTHAIAAFYLPFTRFWELLFGSALAWAQFHAAKRSAVPASDTVSAARLPLRDLASVAGGALIAASFALFDPGTVFPGWRAAFPAGGATLIIAAGPAAWFNRRVLSVKPLTYIGLVSYPFYLWHWPILVFLRLLSSGTPTAAMLIAAIVVAFALSSITFSFIERPARYSRVVRWHPLRPRRDDDGHRPVQLRDFARQRLARPFSRCELRCESGALGIHRCVQQAFPASELCIMPAPNGRPEVALLGDSHANHFYEGLQPALASDGTGLFAVGAGNCPPFPDVDIYLDQHVKHCSELFGGALDYVVNSPDIHSVILSSYAISTIAGGLDYGEGDTIQRPGGSDDGGPERWEHPERLPRWSRTHLDPAHCGR